MADEELSDDYVAKLLAKDAKETSIKYSTLGLQAFNQSKPPANKPKPNTRFLRNIIKDTDSHNAALLAKEAAEARARLRTLPSHQEEKKSVKVGAGDIRKRQLGDIAAILGGRPTKRRKTEGSGRNTGSRYVNTSSEDEKPEEKPRAKSSRDRENREDRDEGGRSRDHRSHHRRHRSVSEDRDRERKERRKRDRSRSRSPRERREKDSKRRYRSRSPREDREKGPKRRHRSPRRKRSSSYEDEETRDKSRRTHRHQRSPSREKRQIEKDNPEPERKPDYDSDPLDDIIGPPPPPKIKIRGRGTISDVSGIDSRFSANYDPMTDVQLDPDEENDWDQALEALRDRQKWKQQGGDRLRAAGFTEEEISKWEKSGEKREADVRWAKQGEGREWDRGKTFDDDGGVQVESSFGRLTDM